MLAAAHLASHKSSRFQHADVARYAGESHRQRSGQVGDAGVTLAQRLQQPAAGGIGQRGIGAIQYLIFNHLVDYNGRS